MGRSVLRCLGPASNTWLASEAFQAPIHAGMTTLIQIGRHLQIVEWSLPNEETDEDFELILARGYAPGAAIRTPFSADRLPRLTRRFCTFIKVSGRYDIPYSWAILTFIARAVWAPPKAIAPETSTALDRVAFECCIASSARIVGQF